jgi:quinoprotein glucose dehydrogenase
LPRITDVALAEHFPTVRVIVRVRGPGSSTGVVCLGVLFLSLINLPSVAQQTPPSLGVSAGVYSTVQARRGEAQYRTSCAACHGVDLRGSEGGNPLIGRAFRSSILDVTVGDLYEKLRATMPEDNPGALPRSAYVDLIAYLLEANGYPPGAGDLVPDTVALNRIRIDRKPDGR